MVQIKLATNTERKGFIADVNDTLQKIIDDNGVDVTGANIMLNGKTVSSFDLDRTLAECGVEDNTQSMMSVVVKATAA